ncbi:hypothetical protein ACH5RR_039106 [Cinchona calisaya]|uniref:Uncharacterized protein n=1 Tax=Cinchona calisaya TaxID=153742 RepID=A0ABD2Y2W4_9GENT
MRDGQRPAHIPGGSKLTPTGDGQPALIREKGQPMPRRVGDFLGNTRFLSSSNTVYAWYAMRGYLAQAKEANIAFLPPPHYDVFASTKPTEDMCDNPS